MWYNVIKQSLAELIFKSTIMSLLEQIKEFFVKPEIYEEAAIAYFNRLPNSVQVSWFRDGKFIVGRITADGQELMTQAFSAKEFVEMVNDAVFSFYGIPKEYFKVLDKKKMHPSKEGFDRLNDAAIQKSTMSLEKEPCPVQEVL